MRLPQVREIDPATEAIGAANTLIVLPDGTLKAINTDWLGFLGDLDAHNLTIQNQHCLILGAGGAAKAVAHALRQREARTVTLVDVAPPDNNVLTYSDLPNVLDKVQMIINCSPVGMSPHTNASPWPEDLPLPSGIILYDLIYNPPVTRLMQQVRESGMHAFGGLGMLVRQGALAFEKWTRAAPPLEVMEQAALHTLEISKD
jgi:shikimate dehydrogenase